MLLAVLALTAPTQAQGSGGSSAELLASAVAELTHAVAEARKPQQEAAPEILDLQPFCALLENTAREVAGNDRIATLRQQLAERIVSYLTLRLPWLGDTVGAVMARVDAAIAGDTLTARRRVALLAAPIRSALGEWRRSLDELRPMLADPDLGRFALDVALDVCLVHGDLASAWPLFRSWEERAAAREPSAEQWLKYQRLRGDLLTQIGILEGAARSLAAARSCMAGMANVDARQRALVQVMEADFLLSAERFEEARKLAQEVMADPATPADSRSRARATAALAALRNGDEQEARAGFAALASAADTHPDHRKRAAIELALLALRDSDLARAREHLAPFLARPVAELTDRALVAVAWLCIRAAETGARPDVGFAELRTAMRRQFDWMLAQWDATPAPEGGLAFLQLSVRRDLLVALCGVTLQVDPGQEGLLACLGHVLAAEARGSTARALGLGSKSLREVRAQVVPPGGVLLVYLPGPTASRVFVVDEERIASAPLPSDTGLRRKVRDLREAAFESRSDARWQERLQRAAEPVASWCLPEPVRAAIAAVPSVAIVGREFMTGIPFECLPWAERTDLGCAKALAFVPSMTLAAAYAERMERARGHDAVLLAASDVDAGDARSFGAGSVPIEAQDLADVAQALDPARVAVRAPAARADLVGGIATDARLAIVIAHGIVDPDRIRPNGLLLGRDPGATMPGTVFAEDLGAAPDLLFLGSCSIGGGGIRRGDDGGHRFGAAMLRAGAGTVVLADGDLDLQATLFLARQFVGELAAGAVPAEALRRARATTAADARFAHPAFHAQVRLEGAGFRPLHVAPRTRGSVSSGWAGVGLSVAAAAILGLALVAARRGAAAPR